MEQQTPIPPPNQGWSRVKGKNAPFSHPWFGGGIGVCCSILFCPRLSESLDWRYSQRHDSNHDKKSAFKCFKLNAFKANLVICQWTHTKQKNSLIISLYEVRYALLTTREFCCVEDKKKTNLCLIHCNNFNKLEGRTPQNIYRNCIGW